LVATDTTSTYFAFGSGAGEEVRGPAIVVLENNIGFEEGIDG
jgi:hypothetical protein